MTKKKRPERPSQKELKEEESKEPSPKEKAEVAEGLPFPVVGIGASAGGIQALKALFSNITETSGMAYVVIQHLDPNVSSNLASIVKGETAMPVHELVDGMKPKPDHVYVLPPTKRSCSKIRLLSSHRVCTRSIAWPYPLIAFSIPSDELNRTKRSGSFFRA